MKDKTKIKDVIKNKWKDVLLVILGIAMIYTVAGKLNQGEIAQELDKGPKVLYVGFESKAPLENFSKEGAVEALVEIIKGIGENRPGNDYTIQQRIEKISKEEATIDEIFTDKTLKTLYYADEFGSDEFNRSFTGNALLTYHELIIEEAGADFGPLEEMIEKTVYLDNKFMDAYIPLDILLGAPTGVAFQMQYVDGVWKLNPYTATLSLHLMGMIEESRSAK